MMFDAIVVALQAISVDFALQIH